MKGCDNINRGELIKDLREYRNWARGSTKFGVGLAVTLNHAIFLLYNDGLRLEILENKLGLEK